MQKDQCSLLLFGSSVLAQVDKCPHGKWTVGYCRVMCPIAQAHCFFPCGQLVQPFYVTFFHVGMHCAHAVSFAFCTLFFFLQTSFARPSSGLSRPSSIPGEIFSLRAKYLDVHESMGGVGCNCTVESGVDARRLVVGNRRGGSSGQCAWIR